MGKDFWRAAAIRAVRTIAQTAIGMLPAAAMIEGVDWVTVASTSLYTGICSILTSIYTGLPEAPEEG